VPELDIQNASREHFARIHRAALMLTGNPWDADDLAQETFLVAAREQSKFRGKSSVYSWLYGILLNLERRHRRQRGTWRRKFQVLCENRAQHPLAYPPADLPSEVAEWKRSLWSAVSELPDGQRQTLVLRFSEEMSYADIAATLDCPIGTVKSRIFHGLQTLRRIMDQKDEASPGHGRSPGNKDRSSAV
jgi:RNA polymerase sigma-70 factor (ECF subfamily)